jgi:GMC oxidoreductase
LASRLAEDKDKSILLIEAGDDPSDDPNIDVPLMADSVRGSSFDWQYQTVPQKHAFLGHIDQVKMSFV